MFSIRWGGIYRGSCLVDRILSYLIALVRVLVLVIFLRVVLVYRYLSWHSVYS